MSGEAFFCPTFKACNVFQHELFSLIAKFNYSIKKLVFGAVPIWCPNRALLLKLKARFNR